MREAETDSHEGKRKQEALWPIFKIHHQKARFDQVPMLGNCLLTIFNFRYIFDLFYRRKAISRELYDYCIKVGVGKVFQGERNFLFSGENSRCCSHSQVEEARIRESVLSEMHPDQGHQLRHQLHLQGPQEQAGGGEDRGVCALWLQGVLWVGGGVCGNVVLVKNKLF